MLPKTTIRKQVLFFGRVQGVGFRYTTCSAASKYPVTGSVRNRSDGSVELIVEGSPAPVERFLEDVRNRMEGCIEREEESDLPITGEFDRFSIR